MANALRLHLTPSFSAYDSSIQSQKSIDDRIRKIFSQLQIASQSSSLTLVHCNGQLSKNLSVSEFISQLADLIRCIHTQRESVESMDEVVRSLDELLATPIISDLDENHKLSLFIEQMEKDFIEPIMGSVYYVESIKNIILIYIPSWYYDSTRRENIFPLLNERLQQLCQADSKPLVSNEQKNPTFLAGKITLLVLECMVLVERVKSEKAWDTLFNVVESERYSPSSRREAAICLGRTLLMDSVERKKRISRGFAVLISYMENDLDAALPPIFMVVSGSHKEDFVELSATLKLKFLRCLLECLSDPKTEEYHKAMSKIIMEFSTKVEGPFDSLYVLTEKIFQAQLTELRFHDQKNHLYFETDQVLINLAAAFKIPDALFAAMLEDFKGGKAQFARVLGASVKGGHQLPEDVRALLLSKAKNASDDKAIFYFSAICNLVKGEGRTEGECFEFAASVLINDFDYEDDQNTHRSILEAREALLDLCDRKPSSIKPITKLILEGLRKKIHEKSFVEMIYMIRVLLWRGYLLDDAFLVIFAERLEDITSLCAVKEDWIDLEKSELMYANWDTFFQLSETLLVFGHKNYQLPQKLLDRLVQVVKSYHGELYDLTGEEKLVSLGDMILDVLNAFALNSSQEKDVDRILNALERILLFDVNKKNLLLNTAEMLVTIVHEKKSRIELNKLLIHDNLYVREAAKSAIQSHSPKSKL